MPRLKRKSDTKQKEDNNELKKKARNDFIRRRTEQVANTKTRQQARLDKERRDAEQLVNTKARQQARLDKEYRLQENSNQKLRRNKRENDFELILEDYEQVIKQGPIFICSCCGGLWYKKSIRSISVDALREKKCTDEFIKKVISVDQRKHWLCTTCMNSVSKKIPSVPRLCLSNGLQFPPIPSELEGLTPLEERLVSLRLPFVQIRTLGSDRQCGLKGNIVNVMNDLDTSAKVLPRQFDEASTVQVMLMRRMCYKSPFMYEVIRPQKVFEAAKYLANTDLYKSEGVVLSDEWANSHDLMDFVVNASDKNLVDELESENSVSKKLEIDVNSDDDERENHIQEETLVITTADRSGEVCRIAPGEGKRPLSLLRDLEAEVLSYPSIYAGVRREFDPKLKITYTDISKSEARRFDRRCCGSSKILYAYKLSQNKRIAAAIQLCLRKKKGDKHLTAGELRNEAFVNKLVQHDDGYRMLKGIRGSPAYWEGQLKKVMAMLRQLGIPTLFMTLSAAETRWPELLVILVWLLRGETITEEEAMNLSFRAKSDLIRNDPITCARNFDHRLRTLLNILLKKPGGVFALHKLVDYFLRVEFQQRGSPHNHGLYWLENAPVFVEGDQSSIVRCIEFIDRYITCERKETDGMDDVIQYQIHKHTHTCKKYTKNSEEYCRFGFPIPPIKSTSILFPLPGDFEVPRLKAAKKNFADLKQFLTGLGRNFKDDMSFESLFDQLGLSEADYLISLRSSIKRPTVFYKRAVNAIFVNPYNETILKAWRANMDIQFILDPYSCAKYCVSYLAKDDSGVSKLLRKINEECRLGNTTVKDKLRKFANTFTNFVEISAQEAAYGLLGMPLIISSVFTEYINTSPPEERVFLIKSQEELDKLPDYSTEIAFDGLLDRYENRPNQLANTCLADFVSFYNYSKTKQGTAEVVDDEMHDDVIEENSEVESENTRLIQIKSGWLKKRQRPKIIRYRRYGQLKDPDNFYREMVMLFVPWWNEDEILNHTPLDLYNKHKLHIQHKLKQYDKNGFSEDVNEYIDPAEEDGSDQTMDPEVLIEINDQQTDIFQDMGLVDQNSKFDYIKSPKLIPDDEYWQHIRSLNDKQRRFFLHVVHSMKTGKLPFYELLHGGAGVGKSRVISCLVQTVARLSRTIPGHCPDDVNVLVAAFTGKAACNVFGITLHSAFRLPNSQNTGDIVRLVDDVCNTLRSKLLHLKLIIIDEISMVSVKQLFQIDTRLKQVFQNELPFGGISILAVGHFRQLKPVMARYIFDVPKFKIMGHLTGNTLWPMFNFYELTEIMRQKGQLEFCTALNNMSEGTMSAEDIALIKTREISDVLKPPDNATRLFYSNADCHHYNMSFHSKLNTEEAISTAIDRIQGKATTTQKEKLLEQAKNLKVGDADGLPYKVHLKVGADFFVSANVDVSDGLFNGCTGTLKKIEYGVIDSSNRIPIRAWMHFLNSYFGANARSRTNRYQTIHNIDLTWTSIDMDTRVLSRTQRHRHQIVRRQIPLVEANAITIHKSQSSSMDLVVVCVKKRMARELLYVACSRATSLGGLYIDGEFKPPIPPMQEDPVTLEMARLRQNPVHFSLRFLQDIEDSNYKLIFHNVQSIHKHFEDILCDKSYQCADVMGFVEPWTLASEIYEFPDFECIQRTDCHHHRNSFGSLVFSKVAIDQINQQANEQVHGHHIFTSWKMEEMNIVMVYRSPSSSIDIFYKDLEFLLKELSTGPSIVFGDFNIDLQKSENRRLTTTFARYRFVSRVNERCPTTDGGTQIDSCFSNVEYVEAWTYESVFSYHKPICIVWPKSPISEESMEIDPTTETGMDGIERHQDVHLNNQNEISTESLIDENNLNTVTSQLVDLNIDRTLNELRNLADNIQRYVNKLSRSLTLNTLSAIRKLFIENSEAICRMTNVISCRDIQIYSGQKIDNRSSGLLPKPFLDHYVPVYTPADGDCFYNALAISLFGSYDFRNMIRLSIVFDILCNVNEYTTFLTLSMTEYSYEDFILNNACSGKWADSSIIYVAAKVCKRPIHSYDMDFGALGKLTASEEILRRMLSPERGDTRHHKYLYSQQDESRKPICIHYRNMCQNGRKNHFVCLLPKSATAITFPCILDIYQEIRFTTYNKIYHCD